MPSEPVTEPTIEQLSAFLDHELDSEEQAHVAEHVAGCADCQSRLEGLRQTAYAIRALPMETPPRSFAIPQRVPRQSRWRWAPVGWIGGVAVAMVIAAVGLTHLNFGPGPAATTASRTVSGGLGVAPNYAAQSGAAAAAPLNQDEKSTDAQRLFLPANSTTVTDPTASSRSLTVATDATSYQSSGVIELRVATNGLTSNEASSVRLWLVQDRGRGGYAIRLSPPVKEPAFPFNYNAGYAIPQMSLPAPVTGRYTLMVQVQLADGSSLIAELPLTISG